MPDIDNPPLLRFRERDRQRQAGDENVLVGIRRAEDDEDAWSKELAGFEPWSRLTPEDKANNTRSHRRCLDRSLHLVVQRKIGETLHWDLPTVIHKGEETMKASAERALSTHCGDQLQATVLGNAP